MNFIEAVGDWKSNDEWRYADKEAAWKFFFAAGKESSQAVISAQCVKMSQYESIIFELRQQLAAEQLNNKLLRDALQEYIDEHEECQDADDWMAMMCSMEAHHTADEALSQPSDTSALDAYVAEKVKEARRTAEYWKENHLAGNEQIATLTRQRDLAVEALEDVKGCFDAAEFEGLSDRIREANVECGSLSDLVMRRLSPALSTVEHAISTIKESEK